MQMTMTERECRLAWLNAMLEELAGPWFGMRSERDALVRTAELLDYEYMQSLNSRALPEWTGARFDNAPESRA